MKTSNKWWQSACALASLLWLAGCSDPAQNEVLSAQIETPLITSSKQSWGEGQGTSSCQVTISDRRLEIKMDWSKPAGTWQGYNVYRADHNGTEWLRLTPLPINKITFTDKSASNGGGYRYRIEAVPKTVGATPLDVCGAEVKAFIALNNASFTSCSAAENEAGVQLDWVLDDASRVRIEHDYRTGQGRTSMEQIHETTVERLSDMFVHTTPAYGTRNNYRLLALKDFTNPFTGETRTLSGSDCLRAAVLDSDLSVTFDGATVRDDGTFLLYAPPGAQTRINGLVSGANGDVTLTFTSHAPERNRHKVVATVSNGRFSQLLPQYASVVEWKLLARDNETARNQQRSFLRIEVLQPEPGTPGELVRGWHIQRYVAESDLNQLDTLTPLSEAVTAMLPNPGRELGVFRAKTWLRVVTEGQHCFSVAGSVATQLHLSGRPILSLPNSQASVLTAEVCAQLRVGSYPLELRQAATADAAHLRVHWLAPQRVWEPLAQVWRDRDASSDATDADGDGVPDRSDAFPNNVHEWFDRDADGTGDHADLDRDGDGLSNATDAFPDDADVLPNESAQPLQAALAISDRQLTLTWPVQPGVAGYRVYRTSLAGDGAQSLSTELLTEPRYVISDVNSGTPYRLALVAVHADGREQPVSRDPLAVWPAWNDQAIVNCSASRIDNGLQIAWQPTDVLASIERKQGDGDWSFWQEQRGGSSTDLTVRHRGRYQYRLTSLLRLRDPFRQIDVELRSAPACLTAEQLITTELVLAVEDLVLTGVDQYEKRPAFVGAYPLRGRITGALGPIKAIAVATDRRVEVVSTDGQFSLPLELDAQHAVWQLSIEETEALVAHVKQARLTFVLDFAAPEIVLDAPQPPLRWQSTATVTGHITDGLTGVESARLIAVASGQEQVLSLAADGRFSIEVALAEGSNAFDVVARDRASNVASASLTFERDSRPPVLTITAPLPATTTFEDKIDVHGNLSWRHDPASLHVKVNGQLAQINVLADSISFVASNIALIEGANTLVVEVQSPVGTFTRSVTVERLVDQQAPTIVLEPLSETVTSQAFVTINGRISDDRSGISRAWLTSSRTPVEQGIPLAEDGRFTISVPLELGENLLAFHALDGRGNTGNVSVIMTRDEGRPSLQISSPIDGTLTDQTQVDLVADVQYAGVPADLQFSVNGRNGVVVATTTSGRYRASVNAIPLVSGVNQLLARLQFPRGVLEDSRRITLDPDGANADDVPPALSLRRPLDGAVLSDDGGTLELSLAASARPVTLTINGQAANSIEWLDPSNARVQQTFTFGNESRYSIDVRVRDSKNREASLSATFIRDADPPRIVVDRLLAEPALNQSPENPFRLTGKVSDERLTSITLNGQPLTLEPGAGVGEHLFNLNVSLTPSIVQVLVLNARDAAGNEAGASYRIMPSAQAGMSILLPVSNAEFISEEASFALNVTAQVEGDPNSARVFARVDQSEWATLTREDRFAQGTVSFPVTDGPHEVTVELRANDDSVLARQTRRFSLRALTSLSLQVASTQPENAAVDIEPNEFIAVHFNKMIDPSKLSITVLETAQGLTYQNLDPSGVDFTQARGAQLIEVSRNREAVPGAFSLLPGKRSVAFYPTRDLAYNGDVFVDVIYDGATMTRFSYRTRPLPTFLGGLLVDPLGQPIVGVNVSLPALKRSTVTDSDGAFAFGFGDTAAQALTAGRHRLVVNTGGQDPAYATNEQWATVEQGRLTDLGVITVQRMNPNVAHRIVEAGADNVVLADGGVRLDLSNAQLRFPDGARSGGMHAQFQPFHELGKPYLPYAVPMWAYSLQPAGITVSGEPVITLTMPMLNGSYDYLLIKDFYVVLIGANEDGNALVPVGVGRVQDSIARSVGALHIKRLDNLGIAMLPFSAQPLLQRYANGELSWNELQSELMAVANTPAVAP